MQNTVLFFIDAPFYLCSNRFNLGPLCALDWHLARSGVWNAQIDLSKFESISWAWRQPLKCVFSAHINCSDVALHPICILDILCVKVVFTDLPWVKSQFGSAKSSIVFHTYLNLSFVVESSVVGWVPGQFNRLVRDVKLCVVCPLRIAEPCTRSVSVPKQTYYDA